MKRKQAKQNKSSQITEPIRKSFFDVLKENLAAAKRATFVHRLIYIGEHTFGDAAGSTIADGMESTIFAVNKDYTDEHLTGLLVCYPKYFCHMIEGSESSLQKHFWLLLQNEKYKEQLGRMKLLVCYHHINQRFFDLWLAVTAKPPSLLEKIDLNSDMERTGRYVINCIRKLYKLALFQRHQLSYVSVVTLEPSIKSLTSEEKNVGKNKEPPKTKEKPKKVDVTEGKSVADTEPRSEVRTDITGTEDGEEWTAENESKSELQSEAKTDVKSEARDEQLDEGEESQLDEISELPEDLPPQAVTKTKPNVDTSENFQNWLPEYGLVEFLLSTPYVQDLYSYIALYNEITAAEPYKDRAWPAPCDFVPLNVFEEPQDPATDLPSSSLPAQDANFDLEIVE